MVSNRPYFGRIIRQQGGIGLKEISLFTFDTPYCHALQGRVLSYGPAP